MIFFVDGNVIGMQQESGGVLIFQDSHEFISTDLVILSVITLLDSHPGPHLIRGGNILGVISTT